MNYKKEQIIETHIQKIVYYSSYADCLSRIITDIIENGNYNLKPSDTPTLTELLNKYINRLHHCIINLKSDWEFYDTKKAQ